MSDDFAGAADARDRRITSWRPSDCMASLWAMEPMWKSASPLPPKNERELSDRENPWVENPWVEMELMVSVSRTGCGLTSRPGLSPSVPSMNIEFLGLMQYSSTLILL